MKELVNMNEKTVNFTLRMTPELRFQLERIAHNEDRTLTNLINMALKRYIDVYNGQKNKGRD
jgi:predicted transcriptional regulator